MDKEMEPQKTVSLSCHNDGVLTVSFTPCLKWLCSAGRDSKVVLTDLTTGDFKKQKIFTGQAGFQYGSSISSDGRLLATTSSNKTCFVWTVENGNSVRLEGHDSYVYCARFLNNDSSKCLTGSYDKTVKFWDIEKRKTISTFLGCKGPVCNVEILPDNRTFVTGDQGDDDERMRIWDIRSPKECVRVLRHHTNTVVSVKFHQGINSIASGSSDKTIKITDFRTFNVCQVYQDHIDTVTSVSFHPSGRIIVSASHDKTVKLFNLAEKRVLCSLDYKEGINNVNFSSDGRMFASGCEEKKVIVWTIPPGLVINTQEDIDEEERVKYLMDVDSDEEVKEFFFELIIDSSSLICTYKSFFYLL